MSFGWGAGDIVLAVTTMLEIVNAFKDSAEEYRTVKGFVTPLTSTLTALSMYTVEDEQGQGNFTPEERREIEQIVQPVAALVDVFRKHCHAHDELGETASYSPRHWLTKSGKKLRWHFSILSELEKLHSQISRHIILLNHIFLRRNMRDQQMLSESLCTSSTKLNVQHEETTTNLQTVGSFVVANYQTSVANNQMLNKIIEVLTGWMLLNGQLPPMIANTSASTISITPSNNIATVLHMLNSHMPQYPAMSPTARSRALKVDHFLRSKMKDWIAGSGGSCPNWLWMCGNNTIDLSGIVFGVLSELGLPATFYRCHRFDQHGNDITPVQLLRELTYSFLYQILSHLVDMPGCEFRLDVDAYQKLNGAEGSIQVAIELIAGLLEAVPTPFILIIDNFENLEGGKLEGSSFMYEECLYRMVSILRRCNGRDPPLPFSAHRILTTTRGTPTVLVDCTQAGSIMRIQTNEHLNNGRYLLAEELRAVVLDEKQVPGKSNPLRV